MAPPQLPVYERDRVDFRDTLEMHLIMDHLEIMARPRK
jgi:hypothetical protein